jgi:hypothetical protein
MERIPQASQKAVPGLLDHLGRHPRPVEPFA